MSSHLSTDLRKKYTARSAPIRKDDEVIIVRGIFLFFIAKLNFILIKNLFKFRQIQRK